jgi:hypothetical protein
LKKEKTMMYFIDPRPGLQFILAVEQRLFRHWAASQDDGAWRRYLRARRVAAAAMDAQSQQMESRDESFKAERPSTHQVPLQPVMA